MTCLQQIRRQVEALHHHHQKLHLFGVGCIAPLLFIILESSNSILCATTLYSINHLLLALNRGIMLACLSQTVSETAPELSTDIVRYFWGHLKSRVGYLVCYKKKVDELQKVFEDLKNRRNDLQRRVERAERNRDVVDDVVNAWLEKANKLEEVVGRMLREVGENKRCFKGCCPDFAWRYKLGKDASEETVGAEKLLEEGKFATVSQPPPPPGIESMPMGDFMAFSSTRKAMDEVLEAMRDEKQYLIGIYGMGGVGKTTLMEELGRQFSKSKEFGTVVKVVVSQNPNIAQIRRDIADYLGMRLLGDGESAARALATRLKMETKVVIMMDDIWARLELRDIGIPTGDEHKGCKILFTTRTLQACHLMESHASILVNVLTPEDSLTLFKSKVGDVSNSRDIEPFVKKVADECGGLPLAIVVVGRALRECKMPSVWESALMQLKRSIPDELLNVEEQLFKSLELSYNYIKNVEMKLLFLFCCLFREDYEISEDELTRYAIGEGYLSKVYTLSEARRKVHLLVQDLVDCCLLLRTDKERFVKMHDVVRDVAVYIASKGEDRFFVKAGLGMREWPETNALELEMCKRISLMNNDILKLPEQPNCPKLLTLLLNFNPFLSGISANFFQKMTSLAVLDLSDTSIESLPSSLALLTNLGALRLDRCKNLRDISLVGQLKKLKILGLQKCPVDILPEEIGTLTDLKLLDLSYSSSLIIPPNLICKLSQLEELFMIGYDLKEALFVQIGSLKRLAYLQLYITDVRYFSRDVEALDGWMNLEKFLIYVESDWYSLVTAHEKNLYLKKVSRAGNWTKILLAKSEDLVLDDCDWDPTGACDFVNVKKLRLVNCSSVDCLLNAALRPGLAPNAFADLGHLVLANLGNLKGICEGEVPALSFKKLRTLDILRCNKLVCIMPYDLLQRAHRTLEVLSVNSCAEVCEIFNSEGLPGEAVMLPELRSVKLTFLPKLRRLWGGVVSHGFARGSFANLKELDVRGCSCLKHLLIPSLARELRNLEKLTVKNNRAMEVIIEAEAGVVLDKGAFPRLKEVELVDLQMLESFYRGEPAALSFDWPMLECVKLELCHKMKRFPIGCRSAAKLKKIQLGDDVDVEWFRGLEWEDASVPSRFEICLDR